MATQKTIFVTEVGKPVTLATRPIPIPKEGEVLIKVTASQSMFLVSSPPSHRNTPNPNIDSKPNHLSVLPHDTYGRDKGLFFKAYLPYGLGTNIAGIVTKLGPGVTKYQIGQHIFGEGSPVAPTPDSTGLQEYATLLVSDSALVPAGFSDDQVCTLPTNAVTAFTALFNKANFAFPYPFQQEFDYAAQTLVIIGAGSNVGRLTVQMAKLVGLGKIIAVASLSGEKELRAMGATHVVDRYSDDIARDVYAITGGQDSVINVMDCVNWTFEFAAQLVSGTRPGKIVTLHQPPTALAELERLGKKDVKAGIALGLREYFTELAEVFWGNIGEWVVQGKVLPGKFRVIEGLDEQKINEALDSYQDGKPVLQAVVHPNP
jgi:NADPH2:quinone reductase